MPFDSFEPAIRGGGQERNRRAGTENAAGIAGFGVAAEAAGRELLENRLVVWMIAHRYFSKEEPVRKFTFARDPIKQGAVPVLEETS